MQLDKQTEKDIQITFHNIIEKTCFIDKLRSITGIIKDRFSEHDPRDTDKITYLNFPPLFYKHGRIDKNYL